MGTKTNMKPYNPINWPAVPHDFTGDNVLGMYTAETTQRYIPGTRFLRWDGSVFKYGRLKGGSVLGMGIFNKSGVVNIGGNAASNMVAGSRTISFDLGGDDGYGGGGIAEDELIGGYIFSSTTTRLIMGNNAAVVSTGTVIVTVDAPYHKAATLPWTEIMLNPYNYLAAAAPANALSAVVGVPVIVSTTGNFIWNQTYGPCGMLSSGSAGNANNQRSLYFASDGSVRDGSELTIETGWQKAGYILDESSGSAGCIPMVFLQISI